MRMPLFLVLCTLVACDNDDPTPATTTTQEADSAEPADTGELHDATSHLELGPVDDATHLEVGPVEDATHFEEVGPAEDTTTTHIEVSPSDVQIEVSPTDDDDDEGGFVIVPQPTFGFTSPGAAIDAAIKPDELPDGFLGLVVAYVKTTNAPVYKFYGKARSDGSLALNEDTLMGIGSVTKTFVGTLLGVAATKGLPIHTTVRSLLPAQWANQMQSSDKRWATTVLDLATHHGGLPKNIGHDLDVVGDIYTEFVSEPVTCDHTSSALAHFCGCCTTAYMDLFDKDPVCDEDLPNDPDAMWTCAAHAPTTGAAGWVYSNVGFEVLGHIIAAHLGFETWSAANRDSITAPLSMGHTKTLDNFTADDVAHAANHCDPETASSNGACDLLDWLPQGNPGGGLFSTAADMVKYLKYNYQIPPDDCGSEARCTLFEALPTIHDRWESSSTGGMELGWQTDVMSNGETVTWKGGANGPFRSWVGFVQSKRHAVILMANSSVWSDGQLGTRGQKILMTVPE